jgi:hypothetical protein
MAFRHLLRATMAAAIGAGIALGAASSPAQAVTILDPGGSFAGKSIADWTAAWWTWALRLPAATNPLSDTTGAYANLNNNGPVFFIVGNNATRTFSVPAGRPVLFPMINFADIEPSPPDPPDLADRIASANLVVQSFVDAVDTESLFATIDGTPVANPASYLEVTGIFSAGPVEPDSLLEAIGIPAGVEAFPMKSGGYWLMINGLTPGPHELQFGGAAREWSVSTPVGDQGQPGFSTNTTDFINVVPEPGSALLLVTTLALLLVPTWVSSRRN